MQQLRRDGAGIAGEVFELQAGTLLRLDTLDSNDAYDKRLLAKLSNHPDREISNSLAGAKLPGPEVEPGKDHAESGRARIDECRRQPQKPECHTVSDLMLMNYRVLEDLYSGGERGFTEEKLRCPLLPGTTKAGL